MRFFALDTRIAQKIRERYCTEGEQEVLLTRYHWLSFLFRSFWQLTFTATLIIIVIFALSSAWPLFEVVGFVIGLWIVIVFFRLLKAFIDWRYDMILLTTEKIVLVDQTSFIRHEEKPIHMENVGGVTAATQFLASAAETAGACPRDG